MKNVSRWLGTAAACGLVGCAGEQDKVPVSHASTMQALEVNTETALIGATDAAAFLTDSTSIVELLSLFPSTETCSSEPVACATGSEPCEVPEPQCESNDVTADDLTQFEADVREGIDDLLVELRTNIFTEQNIEADDGDSVTYRLGPDQLCDGVEPSVATPVQTGEQTEVTEEVDSVDPECAAEVEKYPVRLVVTSESEGNVDVALVLTDARINPVTFLLHQDRLAMQADLAALQSALEEMGQDLGGLQSMSGKLSIELVKNAANDFSFRTNIDSDLSVVAEVEEGEVITLAAKKSTPAMELRANGADREITATYSYSSLSVAGPLNAFRDFFEDGDDETEPTADVAPGEPAPAPAPQKNYTGEIELLIGGYDGSFSFDGNTDVLNFTGLGLGDVSTTLKHNGNTLFQFDLNPDSGRHFDLSVTPQNGGKTILGFSPGLDMSAVLNFSSLADQMEIPEYLMSDTLRLLLEGSTPQVASTGSGLEVLSGELTLTSAAVPSADLRVPAGMCLLEAPEEEAAPVHEVLSQFEVGACE